MRIFIALSLLVCVSRALAQEQEGKLLDRLLRPDVSMQNGAQHKHFTASGNQTDKQAVVAPFRFREKSTVKSFAGAREFEGRSFATRHFRDGDGRARVSKTARFTKTADLASNSMAGTRAAMEADRATTTRNFANTRAFLDQGKSQKALSQQDKPLTIDQVRELLNKNK